MFVPLPRRRFILVASLFGGVTTLVACSAPAPGPSPAATPPAAAKPAGATPAAANATAPTKPAAIATAAPKRTQVVKLKYVVPLSLIFSWLPDYVAVKGGFYEKEMLDVEIIASSGTSAVIQQLIAKSVDFGRAGGISTIVAAVGPLPLVSVMAVHKQIQLNLAVLPDGPIREPRDLKGKIVGVSSRGGAAEWITGLTAAAQGVSRDDFTTQVTGPGLGGYGLMEQGKVDAFVVTDSAEVELAATGKPLKVLRANDYFRMPSDTYLFQTERVQRDPAIVVSALRAVHQGRLFTMRPENWDRVVEYVAAYSPDEVRDPDIAKKKIEKQIALWTDDGKRTAQMGLYDATDWAEGAKVLRAAGYIEKDVDTSKLYTNRFMEQIIAGR